MSIKSIIASLVDRFKWEGGSVLVFDAAFVARHKGTETTEGLLASAFYYEDESLRIQLYERFAGGLIFVVHVEWLFIEGSWVKVLEADGCLGTAVERWDVELFRPGAWREYLHILAKPIHEKRRLQTRA